MSARLTFDEARHAYTLEGPGAAPRVLPSVTEILRAVGLIDLSRIPAHYLDAARDRGTRVHHAAHHLSEGTLEWSTVLEEERGYVEACAAFLTSSGFVMSAQEVRLYSAVLGYAGTTDALGYWQGEPADADYKTGDPNLVAAQYQLAAYVHAIREGLARTPPTPVEWLDVAPTTPIRRLSVRLRRNGTYQITEYRKPTDSSVWLAAVTVYRAQRALKGIAA